MNLASIFSLLFGKWSVRHMELTEPQKNVVYVSICYDDTHLVTVNRIDSLFEIDTQFEMEMTCPSICWMKHNHKIRNSRIYEKTEAREKFGISAGGDHHYTEIRIYIYINLNK